MSRLTDDEITEALAVAQSLNSLRLTAAVAELKERRAQDLSDEERDDMRYAIVAVRNASNCETSHGRARLLGALAALSKLLARGGR